jgi:hypothetical protein
MMKKTIWLACAVLLCAGAAFGGLISEDPGELTVAGQFWLPGEGDSDLFKTGAGLSLSYREWFSFPWGVGVNLGVAQWQVDKNATSYKYPALTEYKGDALLLPVGLALCLNLIDWDNWNLVLETGVQYVFIDSNVSVFDSNNSRWHDVDMKGSVLWTIGMEYEYMISESLYLLGGVGYQSDLLASESDYALGDLRDTYLHGPYARLGVKFLF